MADEDDIPGEDDELLLTDQVDEDAPEPTEGDEQDDEVVIAFGDEPAEEDDASPTLPKHLRSVIRDKDKELVALRRERDELVAKTAPAKIEVGKKPDRWEDDYNTEEDYDRDLLAWQKRKEAAEQQETAQADERRKADEEWAGELQVYQQKRQALGRPDYQDAEDAFVAVIDPIRQAFLVQGLEDSAKTIYALGKSPAKLAELAAIKNPAKFLAAAVKLEGTIKMTTGRKPPQPEQVARGSAPLSAGAGDKAREKLEEAARKRGDYSALVKYDLAKGRK